MSGIQIITASKNSGGVSAATQSEHELAATNGSQAIENKAATPKGLFWFWEKVKTLAQTFTAVITFSQAPKVTAFAGTVRVITVAVDGTLQSIYDVADEFIAVPPTLGSAGIPGQKAYQAPYLYYCVAVDTWIRFLAEGAEYGILEMYVAVPPTPTSTGSPGQRAYDSANSLMYECVATNTWVRYPVTNTW